MTEFLGRLLGIEELETIDAWHLSFDAQWAMHRPMLVVFGCALLGVAGVLYYLRYQKFDGSRVAKLLAGLRAAVLVLLLLILAEPVVVFTLSQNPRSLLLLLFDGTDSMNIADRLTTESRDELAEAAGLSRDDLARMGDEITRAKWLNAMLQRDNAQLLERLQEKFRLRAYVLDRPDQVREINLWSGSGDQLDPEAIEQQLRAEGSVTALGEAIQDLRRRHRHHTVAGAVVFSDFDQNTGRPPLPVAESFAKPLYTVGLGAAEVVDIAVEVQSPLILKKGERTGITVRLRQSGLTARRARVELLQRRLGTTAGETVQAQPLVVGGRTVTLDSGMLSIDVPFTPEIDGRVELIARVDPFDEEILLENNESLREVTVRDESLRLLFIEYEPTWEWRFIKEVFHRDPLIGREGFRTFLRSADFKVRQTNELFLETLVQPRSEFFKYDVIFLSDVTREMLPEPFVEMLEEYVSKFGGGLVVLAGPHVGAAGIAQTAVADMLPVVVDPNARRVDVPFEMRLTPQAEQFDFMQLGATPQENTKAWRNMGRLQWYQPSLKPHPLATVLAEHPGDLGVDSKTPQPIIAIRRYGKGEVVYFAFNETWRLRRMYGEQYYRQLWGQMIYRLGLGRALGDQKRFLAYTDRRTYQAGDKVRITIEAYDEDYQPLRDTPTLDARLIAADQGTGSAAESRLKVPLSRDRVVFETTVPVFAAGPHRLLVRDPVTYDEVEVSFRVAPVSAERRSAVRNTALQQQLASATGGKAYELHEIASLVDDIPAPTTSTYGEQRVPIWNTWFMLIVVCTLMLGEWLIRKLVNLR